MPSVIDTNVLFAFVSEGDAFHDRAAEVVDAIDCGDTEPVHVTDYVGGETLNLVQQRIGHDTAIELLNTIQDSIGFDIVRVTGEDYENTELVFRQEPDLSFIDASIVAYANRIDASSVYSFDDDFDTADLDAERRELPPE